jgi:hypothetical protein
MVEATPATWRDVCERCGCGFEAGESRWIEQRRHLVHSHCADWTKWPEPPYSWKLKELRKAYRQAGPDQRARIVKAGQAIRAAQARWPVDAAEHVQRVVEAMRELG